MERSWRNLPLGRVAYLRGASTEAIELSLSPLPDDAPAVVAYYPVPGATTAAIVESVLSVLEQAAVNLYPVWLPEAERIEGPGGAGVQAVRAMAARLAAKTPLFGPYLAALAELAVAGDGPSLKRFPDGVRAAELAKILAMSYDRSSAAILVDLPNDLSTAAQRMLAAAAEWLANNGNFGVWLAGPTASVQEMPRDRIRFVDFQLSQEAAEIAATASEEPRPWTVRTKRGVAEAPPVEGRPRPTSEAERILESALKDLPWAAGRTWNRKFFAHPYIIDLQWKAERCAVEIDGAEHRGPLIYLRDRRRDYDLQFAGFAILRFTNEEVLLRLDDVVARLEKFINLRRG